MFDGDGQPVPDAMLEVWQADAQGRFADPQDKRALPNAAFRGFGRCGTDENGAYAFDTIKPGQVPDPDGKPQAPHILLAVFARGMLRHLYTRIYFGDEAANAADPGARDGAGGAPRNPDRRARERQRQRRLSPRPAAAGRQRDGVFRGLKALASPGLPSSGRA